TIQIFGKTMNHRNLSAFWCYAIVLFGCSDGSSSRGNSSSGNGSESDLKLTSDNALPVVQSVFNIFDGLNTHLPVLVDEYPNFYFGHLLPDQTQINCDYFCSYSFTLQEQDASNSQRNAGDSLSSDLQGLASDLVRPRRPRGILQRFCFQ